jgi:hypothetical protein
VGAVQQYAGEHYWSLDTFAGQTIYLLIEATDAGGGSLIESGIDDVLIE